MNDGLLKRAAAWVTAHPVVTLVAAVCACLAPFLGKPFNMDDPLFIWSAQHIQTHPLDPFGFNVNWYGVPLPIANEMENPPLASYYMALVGAVFGWSEVALHSAFLLAAVAVVTGTWRVAQRFCQRPLLAAIIVLLTPVFLASSTTVMCDVLMLAFWVWAVEWWMRGVDGESAWPLAISAVLISMAALTKYYGISLLPLLALYAILRRRRVLISIAWLLLPLALICGWLAAAQSLYKHNPITQAAYFAGHGRGVFAGPIATGLIALGFVGGCLAPVVFLAPWLWMKPTAPDKQRRALNFLAPWSWRKGTIIGVVAFVVLLVLALAGVESLMRPFDLIDADNRLFDSVQVLFWVIGGAAILVVTVADVWQWRDAPSALLAAWVIGTFIFTTALNWTVNGRSILPMAPAVGILVARRLGSSTVRWGLLAIPLVMGGLLAIAVARADFAMAKAARQSARQVHDQFAQPPHTLWFQGHWGFQYYMMAQGDLPLDVQKPGVHTGDFLAIPVYNTESVFPNGPGTELDTPGSQWLTDMNKATGAGFYSSIFGPLPFALGAAPPERVMVWPVRMGGK